jgi:hypothetical protein
MQLNTEQPWCMQCLSLRQHQNDLSGDASQVRNLEASIMRVTEGRHNFFPWWNTDDSGIRLWKGCFLNSLGLPGDTPRIEVN